MDLETLQILMTEKFNNIVDELVPLEEEGFKKYAKENLNGFQQITSKNRSINAHKILSKHLSIKKFEFTGAKKDSKSQHKYAEWSWQIPKLFIQELKYLFKEIIPEDLNDEFTLKLKESFKDLIFQVPPFLKSGATEVQDYLVDQKTVDSLPPPFSKYYFNLTKDQVEKLYQLLLEKQLIQENKHFLQAFDLNNKSNKYISTWNHKQTSAFYLLYLLNNKSYDFNNINLGRIYLELFKRNVVKSESSSISTNFGKFRTDTSKKEFIPKYSVLIESIYSSLSL